MSDEFERHQDVVRQVPRTARPDLRPALRPESESAPPECLWGIEDVAGYLQVSVNAVYKMTARKASVRIPHIRIGGKLRFRQADIDRWLSLLTVSNLDTLTKVRGAVGKKTHGYDSQAQAP